MALRIFRQVAPAAAGCVLLLLLHGAAWADCGPGPLVIQDNKGMLLQSLGATTNATLLPIQTLAITSGTSGCSSSGLVRAEYEQRVFVAVSFDNIEQDLATGGGPHLTALAGLMGCSAVATGRLAALGQERIAAWMAGGTAQPRQLLANLRGTVAADPLLAAGCTRWS